MYLRCGKNLFVFNTVLCQHAIWKSCLVTKARCPDIVLHGSVVAKLWNRINGSVASATLCLVVWTLNYTPHGPPKRLRLYKKSGVSVTYSRWGLSNHCCIDGVDAPAGSRNSSSLTLLKFSTPSASRTLASQVAVSRSWPILEWPIENVVNLLQGLCHWPMWLEWTLSLDLCLFIGWHSTLAIYAHY